MIVLGVDPGSQRTGYSLIRVKAGKFSLVDSGVIDVHTLAMERRLARMHAVLEGVIDVYAPSLLVLERIFFAENAVSALKLGQARGVVMLLAGQKKLTLLEFAPTEVKHLVAGYGHASKEQLLKTLELLLALAPQHRERHFPTADASDATALALLGAIRKGAPRRGSISGFQPGKPSRLGAWQALAERHLKGDVKAAVGIEAGANKPSRKRPKVPKMPKVFDRRKTHDPR